MNEMPDMAAIASLIGEPARARIMLALMGGRAMTASELALEANVLPPTASVHLSKLTSAGLIQLQKQGRHRYFQIANEHVAEVVEKLCGVAEFVSRSSVRAGPKDPAMRYARVCYDHLAGELSVVIFESVVRQEWLSLCTDGAELTAKGARSFGQFGIDVGGLGRLRRPTCRQCLDWSERRHHLAGALGAALLSKILERRLGRKDPTSRVVHFSRSGKDRIRSAFGL